MAFVKNVVEGALSYAFGNSTPGEKCIQAPIALFNQKLFQFSIRYINQADCIQSCVQSAIHSLNPDDYFLSDTSQKKIEQYFKDFNTAVDEKLFFSSDHGNALKIEFAKSLCTTLEDSWANLMAQSFYPIASINNAEKQITEAQRWTHDFIAGLFFLNRWENRGFYLSIELIEALNKKTSQYLNNYSHQMLENKMKQMQLYAEKNPNDFAKDCQRVKLKKEKDPSSLSLTEKEIDDFIEAERGSILLHVPDIYKKMELLNKCIWHGYSLQQFSQSILDSNTSHSLFKTTFDKDEVDEKT